MRSKDGFVRTAVIVVMRQGGGAARIAAVLALAGLTVGAPAQAASPGDPRRSPGEVHVRANVPVTANHAQAPLAQNSPVVAVDPTDDRFVALAHRIDYRSDPRMGIGMGQFGCALQLSGDGGATWVPAEPVPQLPEGADTCYAPQVAFEGDGTLHYLFVGLHGPGNVPMGVFLTSSTDRGRTFTEPRQVLGGNAFGVRLAIDDGGRMHLVWLQAHREPPLGGLPPGDNPIMWAHSNDSGQTFSQPVRVSQPQRQRVAAPALETGPDGAVHMAYYDLRGDTRDYQGLKGPTWEGKWSLIVATAPDGGGLTRHRVAADGVVPPERVMLIFTMPPPALAAGPDGRVYLGWHDARNGDWDAFVARSADQGRTWRAPVRVNDDAAGAGGHQYLPQLNVAETGRVDALFYDRRRDPENQSTDVFFAASRDGGQSFSENVRVTSRAFRSQIGPRYAVPSAEGLVEFGATLALHSTHSRALAAWTDTRNADGPRHQDIFAAEVTMPGGPAHPDQARMWLPSATWWLAGSAVVAALAAALWALTRRRARLHAGAPAGGTAQ